MLRNQFYRVRSYPAAPTRTKPGRRLASACLGIALLVAPAGLAQAPCTLVRDINPKVDSISSDPKGWANLNRGYFAAKTVQHGNDGESRIIGAGEVILVEDTTGKGHLSKAVEGKLRHCIFVPID